MSEQVVSEAAVSGMPGRVAAGTTSRQMRRGIAQWEWNWIMIAMLVRWVAVRGVGLGAGVVGSGGVGMEGRVGKRGE